jgi:hypothetical protein
MAPLPLLGTIKKLLFSKILLHLLSTHPEDNRFLFKCHHLLVDGAFLAGGVRPEDNYFLFRCCDNFPVERFREETEAIVPASLLENSRPRKMRRL